MRAIGQNQLGPPGVLHLTDAVRPTPGRSEVLVRIRAAGVNRIDAAIRSGRSTIYGPLPFILGAEYAGSIAELGPGVGLFAISDEVFGMPRFPAPAGAYAEYAVSPSRHVVARPDVLDPVSAAALPLAGLTAWQGLIEHARLKAGQRVLIHAAGGGVGHIAVQIAKAHGAYVLATASEDKLRFVQSLGADEVIDYRPQRFELGVRDADIVFDLLGGDVIDRSLRALRPGGTLLTAIDYDDAQVAARVEGAGFRFVGVSCEPDRAGLLALADLVV